MGIFEGELHVLQDQDVDDQKLYHYTTATTLAKILDSGALRMDPYSRTNDPREQKEWVPLFTMPPGPERPPEKYLATSADDARAAELATDRYLRRGARLACFTLDRQRAQNATAGTLFHRGWARARMWEQYSGRHTGACLVFERSELVRLVDEHLPHGDGDLFSCGSVTYDDQALTIPLPWMEVVDQGIDAVLDDFQVRKGAADQLYFTKNTDWRSEEEFRIVCVQWNVSDEEEDQPITVPYESSLLAIVLGEHFPDTELSVIRSRTGLASSVDLLRCEWHSGVPCLFYV